MRSAAVAGLVTFTAPAITNNTAPDAYNAVKASIRTPP